MMPVVISPRATVWAVLAAFGLVATVVCSVSVLVVPGRDTIVRVRTVAGWITLTRISAAVVGVVPVSLVSVVSVVSVVLATVIYSVFVLVVPGRHTIVWVRTVAGWITLAFIRAAVAGVVPVSLVSVAFVVLATVVYSVSVLVVPGRDTAVGVRTVAGWITLAVISATVAGIVAARGIGAAVFVPAASTGIIVATGRAVIGRDAAALALFRAIGHWFIHLATGIVYNLTGGWSTSVNVRRLGRLACCHSLVV